MNESLPISQDRPRYSDQPFPRYSFVPGETPHPRRHERGHAFGQPELKRTTLEPGLWRDSQDYKFAIDLFNFGYWWESHELFEAFWNACGRHTAEGRFFQGLIQLAAGHLKRRMGNTGAAIRLMNRACVNLRQALPHCMGIDVATLVQDIEQSSTALEGSVILLRLNVPPEKK